MTETSPDGYDDDFDLYYDCMSIWQERYHPDYDPDLSDGDLVEYGTESANLMRYPEFSKKQSKPLSDDDIRF